MDKKGIFYFYYNANNIGGVQILFLRTALALKNEGCNVVILGKEIKGYFLSDKTLIKNNDIKIEKLSTISWFFKIFSLTAKDKVITVGSYWYRPWFLICFVTKVKTNLWCVHPNNLIRFTNYPKLKSLFLTLIKPYLRLLLSKKILKFMDFSNVLQTEKAYNFKIQNPNYWPITKKIKETSKKEIVNEVQIKTPKLLWVGRIDVTWKTDSLYPLFKYCDANNCHLTIIGAGKLQPKLAQKIEQRNNINLIMNLPNEELLNKYSKFDIVFGMGTILIEASENRTPTFSFDISDKSGFGVWFFDRKGYSLGGDGEVVINPNKILVEQAIEIIKMNKQNIGEKCYDHVYKHHNVNSFVNKFLN